MSFMFPSWNGQNEKKFNIRTLPVFKPVPLLAGSYLSEPGGREVNYPGALGSEAERAFGIKSWREGIGRCFSM